MKRFEITISCVVTLDTSMLWPDGDAPETPTIEDVQELIESCGDTDIIKDWGLEPNCNILVREVGR